MLPDFLRIMGAIPPPSCIKDKQGQEVIAWTGRNQNQKT